ncbi:MAG: hypothetical protein OFPI_33200 [Osedax symbiont Rs2]|nr:MAG: hypothetical protein OFPI_33200 [Osedax symbiont Rs2]
MASLSISKFLFANQNCSLTAVAGELPQLAVAIIDRVSDSAVHF